MSREETICFSGLTLEEAVKRLREKGIEPQITFTRAPKSMPDENAVPRVIRVQEQGRRVTAAFFERGVSAHET